MTQIACLAVVYSRIVLQFTYLVFVPYKDISRVHFDGRRTCVFRWLGGGGGLVTLVKLLIIIDLAQS